MYAYILGERKGYPIMIVNGIIRHNVALNPKPWTKTKKTPVRTLHPMQRQLGTTYSTRTASEAPVAGSRGLLCTRKPSMLSQSCPVYQTERAAQILRGGTAIGLILLPEDDDVSRHLLIDHLARRFKTRSLWVLLFRVRAPVGFWGWVYGFSSSCIVWTSSPTCPRKSSKGPSLQPLRTRKRAEESK